MTEFSQILSTEPSMFTRTSMRSMQSILVISTEVFWKRQSSKVKSDLFLILKIYLYHYQSIILFADASALSFNQGEKISSHDFFQLSRTAKSKNILLRNEISQIHLMSRMTFKKINYFFITNRHSCKKTYVVFIHSFGRKKDAFKFEIERSSARIRQLQSQDFFFCYLVTQRSNRFLFDVVSSSS